MSLRPFTLIALLVTLTSCANTSDGSAPVAHFVPPVTRVRIDRDVIYANRGNTLLRADIYYPAEPRLPRAAIVFFHGGGWSAGSRAEFAQIAHLLSWQGYVAMNVEYRLVLGGQNSFPAQRDDARAALAWLRDNAATYSVDPARVCAAGISAGGHLAAFTGTTDAPAAANRANCVIALSAPFDLTQPLPVTHDMNVEKLVTDMVGAPRTDAAAYRAASPISHIDARTPPFLVIHSTNDSVVPVQQSRAFAAALRQAQRPVTYIEWDFGHHGVSDDATFNGFVAELLAFMRATFPDR